MPRKSKKETDAKKKEKKPKPEIPKKNGKGTAKHTVQKNKYETYIRRIAKKLELKVNPEVYASLEDMLNSLLTTFCGNINLGDFKPTITPKMLQASVAMYANSRGVQREAIKSWIAAGTKAVETFDSA